MAQQLPQYKTDLITMCIEAQILKFGSFTLKSGRQSPYFFNAGLFHVARQQKALILGFAQTLADSGLSFDVVFGPAYKGIVLSALTIDKLADIDQEKYCNVSWSFNRKEKKDHGEGGSIVGSSLKGKKIVIIDDVITAGTAIRESIDLINAEGGELVGIIVAFNRQERLVEDSDESAISKVQEQYGIPVLAILKLDEVVEYLKKDGTEEQLKALENYRQRYKARS